MFDSTTSVLLRKFTAWRKISALLLIFAFILYLEELLERVGGNTFDYSNWEYLLKIVQLIVILIVLMSFIKTEKHVQQVHLKDSFLHAVIENMYEGIAVCDSKGNLVFFKNTSTRSHSDPNLPSYPIPPEKWEKYWTLYQMDGARIKFEDFPLVKALRGKEVKNQQLILKHDGECFEYLSVNGKQIIGESGEILGALIVVHDITEQKQTEEKMRYMAFHDSLTGLPNLRYFKDKVSQYVDIEKGENNEPLISIMFLDLDKFKTINDVFGHFIGDQLLKEVCKRITSCLKENDIAARIGGDEFIILLPNIKTEEEVIHLAQKIIDKVSTPYQLQGINLEVTTSIGISFFPKDGLDGRTLIKHADLAMYNAKRNGKNQYSIYEEQIIA